MLNPDIRFDSHQHELLLGLFDALLEVGGLPEVVLAGPEGHKEVRAQILADYERDFIRLSGEDWLPIIKSCFRSVANFVGSPAKNASVVANPSSTLNDRIGEVFSRLESWYLLMVSQQRGPGPEGSHRCLPKRYMFDPGILRHIRETADPSIQLMRYTGSRGKVTARGNH